jgi:hypothetical protein
MIRLKCTQCHAERDTQPECKHCGSKAVIADTGGQLVGGCILGVLAGIAIGVAIAIAFGVR